MTDIKTKGAIDSMEQAQKNRNKIRKQLADQKLEFANDIASVITDLMSVLPFIATLTIIPKLTHVHYDMCLVKKSDLRKNAEGGDAGQIRTMGEMLRGAISSPRRFLKARSVYTIPVMRTFRDSSDDSLIHPLAYSLGRSQFSQVNKLPQDVPYEVLFTTEAPTIQSANGTNSVYESTFLDAAQSIENRAQRSMGLSYDTVSLPKMYNTRINKEIEEVLTENRVNISTYNSVLNALAKYLKAVSYTDLYDLKRIDQDDDSMISRNLASGVSFGKDNCAQRTLANYPLSITEFPTWLLNIAFNTTGNYKGEKKHLQLFKVQTESQLKVGG